MKTSITIILSVLFSTLVSVSLTMLMYRCLNEPTKVNVSIDTSVTADIAESEQRMRGYMFDNISSVSSNVHCKLFDLERKTEALELKVFNKDKFNALVSRGEVLKLLFFLSQENPTNSTSWQLNLPDP